MKRLGRVLFLRNQQGYCHTLGTIPYRLLRLVEEMVLGGKSGEKEQALMHKRQETYEERLKIQYQKKYSMKGAEPNSSFKHVQKVVCGWSKEFIGKSDVSTRIKRCGEL